MARAYDKAMSRVTIVKAGGYHLSYILDRHKHLARSGRVFKRKVHDLVLFGIEPQINN